MLSVIENYIESDDWMTVSTELEGMCKNVVMASIRFYPRFSSRN